MYMFKLQPRRRRIDLRIKIAVVTIVALSILLALAKDKKVCDPQAENVKSCNALEHEHGR